MMLFIAVLLQVVRPLRILITGVVKKLKEYIPQLLELNYRGAMVVNSVYL